MLKHFQPSSQLSFSHVSLLYVFYKLFFAFISIERKNFCKFATENNKLSMRTEHLDFITFCVGSLSDSLQKSASQVYEALRSSGVLADYILPCYDVLHTFSKDYLVEELTEVLKERGALA